MHSDSLIQINKRNFYAQSLHNPMLARRVTMKGQITTEQQIEQAIDAPELHYNTK